MSLFVGYTPKAKSFCVAAHILRRTAGREWHQHLQNRFTLHPAVVAAFMLDDPHDWQQLLLEWPYVAQTDKTRLAYTRDERSGKDDRQTLTSLGKYLKRHWPDMADHAIRDYVAKYATEAVFRISRRSADIVDAVQNGPASCMKFNDDEDDSEQLDALGHHPYETYDPQYGWHIATRHLAGRIVGRALLMQRDNDETKPKYFVRTYKHKDGESFSQPDDELIQWLKEQGYFHGASWGGERLAYLHSGHSGCDFVAPYIDGAAQCVDIEHPHGIGKWLRITSNGDWECTNQNGTADERNTCSCECCGERISEEDSVSVGLHYDTTIGQCCIDDYTYVYGRRGNQYHIPENEAVRAEDGEYYDPNYLADNNLVETHDGDYISMDDAVYIDSDNEWYHTDDEAIVQDHDGEWQLRDDCVQLYAGEWALQDEAWECAGSGNYYLHADDRPVEVDGENYHEDYLPEQDEEDETDDEEDTAPVTTKESA